MWVHFTHYNVQVNILKPSHTEHNVGINPGFLFFFFLLLHRCTHLAICLIRWVSTKVTFCIPPSVAAEMLSGYYGATVEKYTMDFLFQGPCLKDWDLVSNSSIISTVKHHLNIYKLEVFNLHQHTATSTKKLLSMCLSDSTLRILYSFVFLKYFMEESF